MRLSPCSTARLWSALALVAAPCIGHAARPLSTDDAAAAESCQLEAFHEGARTDPHGHNSVVAAACGGAPGLELGLEATHFQPVDEGRWGLSAGLKWAPEHWQWAGAHWGLKFTLPVVKGAELGWHTEGAALLALASWDLSPTVALHVNLGLDHKRHEATTDHMASLALVWTPADPWLFFAETLHEQRSAAQQIAGLRHWLQQDTLGLDLTVGRVHSGNGASGFNCVTIGFGWYGLGLH